MKKEQNSALVNLEDLELMHDELRDEELLYIVGGAAPVKWGSCPGNHYYWYDGQWNCYPKGV